MSEAGSYKRSLGLFELVSLGVGGTIGSGIFVVPGSGRETERSLVTPCMADCCHVRILCSPFPCLCIFHGLRHPIVFIHSSKSVFGARFAFRSSYCTLFLLLFGSLDHCSRDRSVYSVFWYFKRAAYRDRHYWCLLLAEHHWYLSFGDDRKYSHYAQDYSPGAHLRSCLFRSLTVDNFVPQTPVTVTGFLATIIIVYWPFTGFEISAIPVEETRDPKLIRRSLILVMGIVVSLYLLLNVALIGSVGAEALAASPAPLATAAAIVFDRSGTFIAIIGIVAMLSAINAYIIGTSRILQSMSAQFSVPEIRDLNLHGTPVYALITGSAISAALLLFSNHFDQLATISVITTLIPYIFFCLASWVLVTDTKARLISAAGAISTASILIIYFIV